MARQMDDRPPDAVLELSTQVTIVLARSHVEVKIPLVGKDDRFRWCIEELSSCPHRLPPARSVKRGCSSTRV